jgi:Mor family transcriptional regulator
MARAKRKVLEAKRGKYSEVLEIILGLICTEFIEELKMDPATARQAAELAVETLRTNAGGGGLYIAKGHLFAVTENHRRIYRRFNGSNHFQLAREFNLSERQIYTIVERCQQEDFGRRQMKLFAEET